MGTPAKPQEVSRRRLAIPGVVVALAAAACLTPTVLADRIESRQVSAATTARAEPRPASWQTRLDYSQVTPTLEIVLSSPGDMEETVGRSESRPRTPLQVGFRRQLPERHQGDLASSATWSVLSDGSQVASISVQSPGAARLRLALQAVLPAAARIRFFGPGTEPRRYPPYSRDDFARTGAHRLDAAERESGDEPRAILWSPIVDGDTVGIEIEVPAGAATSDVQLRVERLSHFPAEPSPEYRRQNGTSRAPTDDTCPLVDVACKDLPDCPGSAVARIVFTGDDGDSYVCSGTAVNTARSETENLADPYFLTAHHCIGSQSAADSMETDWFFEHVDCEGSVLSENHSTLHFGGELLATDAQTDMSLLELRDALPAGVCLSGWSATEAGLQTADSELVALHHAEGQPKKYSAGSPGDYGVALVDDLVVDILEVAWSEGHTLPGSSGAGLFAPEDDGDRPLIGVLSGSPPEECPGAGAFGRLDLFYVNHAQRYLNPDADPISDDYGGDLDAATGLLLDSEVSARIDHRADTDVFRIEVTESGTVTLFTAGDTNTVGRLLHDDGSLVDYDVVGGFQNNFRIVAKVTAGTYYIRVTGYDPEAVGDYRLHVGFAPESEYGRPHVPLFLSASDARREGFVRILNTSNRSGTMEITAFDDDGVRHGPVTLSIGGHETRHFNSTDLERGNSDKGLSGSTGTGSGDWWLRIDSDLVIEVATYIRTADGFLTAMHDVAYLYETVGQHFLPTFNPGSNTSQRSLLRIVNPDTTRSINVLVIGQDDSGDYGRAQVQLSLPPGGARTVASPQLEAGDTGLQGSLGDGTGKWRLWVEADGDVMVLSLLESPTGHLTNLSSPGHIVR